MRGTGGEGFVPPLQTVVLLRIQDDHIRDHQKEKVQEADEPTVGINKETKSKSVHADKFQQRVQITHEMNYDTGATEWQPDCEENLNSCMDQGTSQATAIRKLHTCWLMMAV